MFLLGWQTHHTIYRWSIIEAGFGGVRCCHSPPGPASFPLSPHLLWSSFTNWAPAMGLLGIPPTSFYLRAALAGPSFCNTLPPDLSHHLQVFSSMSPSQWGLSWPPWLQLQPPLPNTLSPPLCLFFTIEFTAWSTMSSKCWPHNALE